VLARGPGTGRSQNRSEHTVASFVVGDDGCYRQSVDLPEAVGKITKEDYDGVVIPLIDEAAREGRRLRCLCEVGPDFQGLTPSAAWKDLKIGLRALRMIDACAVVSDIGWIRESSNLAAFYMPCPVRVFELQERDKAIGWLSSLPEGAGVSARLEPEPASSLSNSPIHCASRTSGSYAITIEGSARSRWRSTASWPRSRAWRSTSYGRMFATSATTSSRTITWAAASPG
jgi:SpoIIAA-like